MAKAAFGATIVPRHVLGGPGYLAPSDRVNIGVIGMGGRGQSVAWGLVEGGQNIVAVADVDWPNVEAVLESRLARSSGPNAEVGLKLKKAVSRARRYADFREMLEDDPDLDAVLIATADHTHGIAAKRAMERGKHVYVEKPLTQTIHEARVLGETARRTGVVTQMGNQGRSTDDVRRLYEWIQAGVIGPVREVHVWTDSPRWAQGIPHPAPAMGRPAFEEVDWRQDVPRILAGALGGTHPVPPALHWDLFLGPAPWVDYHPMYHPRNWRGWTDWGGGAIGDMGAHLIEPPFTALNLGLPTQVYGTSTDWGGDPDAPATYPVATRVHMEFPARGGEPPVVLHWSDAGLHPPRPELLPEGVKFANGGGYFVGDDGILIYDSFGSNPRIFPERLMQEAQKVPQKYPRVEERHEMNWIRAIRGDAETTSPIPLGAVLTELILLPWVALRTGHGVKIRYDADAMSVVSHPDSNRYLRREYRRGWELQ